ncbi:MAG: DNA repair ATPase, partial [Tannerella sp.]|nr:DNA repair ATPase [Tannerella sp.]
QNGDHKLFESNPGNLEFFRKVASPNGEDFLYIFYQNEKNIYVLMSYNVIRQQVETPVICNGYTVFRNGTLILFRSEPEAARHHRVEIWESPYSLELKENQAEKENFLYKIGNKSIVKAMAECQEVIQLVNREDTYEGLYEDMIRKSNDIIDSYFWISGRDAFSLSEPLGQIREIANTAVDEFDRVKAQRKHAGEELDAAAGEVNNLSVQLRNARFDSLEQHVKLLAEIRKTQGEVIELAGLKYVNPEKTDGLKQTLSQANERLSARTVTFLLKNEALAPYEGKVKAQRGEVEKVKKVIDAGRIEENCRLISSELGLLIDILNSLKIEDTTQATKIIEKISFIFASLNEVRALLKKKTDSLRSGEAAAEFHAQLTLLEQGIINYLELATSPGKVDEYFTKASVQIEELESKFADFDTFVSIIADKRTEIVKAFDGRRTQLIEQINRRTASLEQIGLRVLKNVENKAQSFQTKEEIRAFYATDLMVDKVRRLVDDLRELGDVSKAENLENSLKASLEDALRILKDKTELFVDGEHIISLGSYKFAVNRQSLDLTMVRRGDRLFYHLTGTNFYRELKNEEILRYRDLWEQEVVSENSAVYRSEYLAFLAFQEYRKSPSFNAEEFILKKVEQSYSESYLKGVHDYDALQIYGQMVSLNGQLGVLSFRPQTRVAAWLFWHAIREDEKKLLRGLIVSAANVLKAFPASRNYRYVINRIIDMFMQWNEGYFDTAKIRPSKVADYLFREFAGSPSFTVSGQSKALEKEFLKYLESNKLQTNFNTDVADASFGTVERYYLVRNWLSSFIDLSDELKKYKKYRGETACLLLLKELSFELRKSPDSIELTGLRGSHPAVIADSTYRADYHALMLKLNRFCDTDVPAFHAFTELKETLVNEYRKSLKINELKPRVLTSFV